MCDRDILELQSRYAPTIIRVPCGYCGGFGRCAIPERGAIVWATRKCTTCAGTGTIAEEA